MLFSYKICAKDTTDRIANCISIHRSTYVYTYETITKKQEICQSSTGLYWFDTTGRMSGLISSCVTGCVAIFSRWFDVRGICLVTVLCYRAGRINTAFVSFQWYHFRLTCVYSPECRLVLDSLQVFFALNLERVISAG